MCFKRKRPFKYYDCDTFYEKYRLGMYSTKTGDVVMIRRSYAMVAGKRQFIVYDDEMDVILNELEKHNAFYNQPTKSEIQ